MRRYLFIFAGVLVFFLGFFLLVEALGVPLLTDPTPWLGRPGWAAASVGVGLLVADVLLPVPSSLVMIAHGALFGVAKGALLSLAGSLGATLLGFALGRRGGPLLARLVSAEERTRADRLLGEWGALAVVVTRPVPLLAETVAIMAGASPLGWRRVAAAALAGSLPGALLYAFAGATAARSLQNGLLVFSLVIAVAALFWLAGRYFETHFARKANGLR
jgi:uncharacterized membrane protein YdjX (TVP38/TMEM64 family)